MIQTIEELHRARQSHVAGTEFPWRDVSMSLLNHMFRESYSDDRTSTRSWGIIPDYPPAGRHGIAGVHVERFDMPVEGIRAVLRDRIHGAITANAFESLGNSILVESYEFTQSDLELLGLFAAVEGMRDGITLRQLRGEWRVNQQPIAFAGLEPIYETPPQAEESRTMEEIEHAERGPVLVTKEPEVPIITLSEAQVFYLKQLCGINGISYESLDKNLYVGVMDRKEINKIFFSTKPKYESIVIAPSHRKVLKEILGHFNDTKRVQQRLEQAQSRYRDYTQHAQNEYSTIVSCMKQLEAMKAFDGASLIPSVEKLLSEGKVELSTMSTVDKFIEFKMLHDCILREVNAAQGIDRTLNMGRYKLRLDLKNYRMNVYPLTNNFEVDGYFHPHVNYEGNICWGNAKEAMERAFMETNVYDLVNITLILLSEYNPASPFKALYLFEREQKYESMGRYWVKESVLFAQTGLTSLAQISYINSCIIDGDRFIEINIYEERSGDKTCVLNAQGEMLDIKETPIVPEHPEDKEAADEMDDFEIETEDETMEDCPAVETTTEEGYF